MTLLLVEDNPPDALMVREAIREENLPVEFHVLQDGERALDFLARLEKDPAAPAPDALLLDLNLPRIDGLEVLRRIRAGGRYGNIPVLVVTSSDAPTDRSAAAQLGAGYFRKPPNYEQFLKLGAAVKTFLTENGLL